MFYSTVIPSLNLDAVLKKIQTEPEEVMSQMEALLERDIISVSNLGISEVDSKLLYVWKQQGLLPFFKQENPNKRIWWRFSFIEVCWVKLLAELRKVGVGMSKLQELTNFFFPDDYFDLFYKETELSLDDDQLEYLKQIQAESPDGFNNSRIYLKSWFEKYRISRFSILVFHIVLTKSNKVLFSDENQQFNFIDIHEIEKDPVSGITKIKEILNNHTTVFVNITKIIADVSCTHEYFSSQSEIGSKMSENSIDIMRKLFKDNDVSEVTIRVKDNGRPTVYIKRWMDYKELGKNVSDLKKIGTFQDVVIKTRNGQIKYFQITEVKQL